MQAERSVAYGLDPEGLLRFLLESNALALRQLSHALNAALTWADFWTWIPEVDREELERCLADMDEELPRDETPFDQSLLPGVNDGDYPEYAPAFGTDWMPRVIEEAYGVGVDSFVSGSWFEYPGCHEADIVAKLRELGYSVRRDDELIAEACGY